MAVADMKDNVDAFAACGLFAVRNPAQELAVAALIRELTGYPVVCAHQLSSDLGFHERAVTAVLNARLMPLITDLIEAVTAGMQRRGICAPLMVVKGDGSLISAAKAQEKPIETILSGPAASITGHWRPGVATAHRRHGRDHDRPGWLKAPGAKRPGHGRRWLTWVKAAEITTIGLGGQLNEVSQKGPAIGPQRYSAGWIVPVSALVGEQQISRLIAGHLSINRPRSWPILKILNLQLTATENRSWHCSKTVPIPSLYRERLNKDFDLLPQSGECRFAARASLTPTDILHVTGAFTVWNRRLRNRRPDRGPPCQFKIK